MKRYKITFGSGLILSYVRFVDVEDFECAQDAVDKMIDQLERDKNDGCFLSQKQIDSGEHFEDEYVIGGNNGRYLHHHGIFSVVPIG